MLYLDSNATTRLDPHVLEAMLPFLTEQYANPSASYHGARAVRKAVDTAREQIAALLEAEPDEIMFTSGGTEANNAALFSALTLDHPYKTHLITAKTEHSAVLEPARRWMLEGYPVSFLDVESSGILDAEELAQCARTGQTALVSVMWANNETGVIAPVAAAAEQAHNLGAIFHTDAVQAVGKIPVSVKQTPIDYLSLSGHKFHGPKGIGALYISKRVRFNTWMLGGGQEAGRRSGTENVAGIVGLGKAAVLARLALEQGGPTRIAALRDQFESAIRAALPEVSLNGCADSRLPNTSNLHFPGVDAVGLLILLDEKGIACSGGSACHTVQLHPSHVLEAMGYDAAHAASSVRFSFSRFTTDEEVTTATQAVIQAVRKLRSLRSGDGWVTSSAGN